MILILQLDDSKALGHTDIPIKIIKISAPIIVPLFVKIINIKNPKGTSISQIKIDERIIEDPREFAESVNNYFVDIGKNTDMNIPINPIIKPEKYLKNENLNNFIISDVTI